MRLLRVVGGLMLLFITVGDSAKLPHRSSEEGDDILTQRYWYEHADKTLQKKQKISENLERGKAKNIIFFLGDGMGMSTITAARIYKGQKAGLKGAEAELTFEDFPHVSLSKTYAIDRQTSDSANTATAYLCGVKANYGTLGVNGKVKNEDCDSSKDNSTHVSSILQWAQEEGKSTGFVTTTRVTHATPAGLYAHSASRDWEAESPGGDEKCPDIALQLVKQNPGKNIQVILGGGRQSFFPNNEPDVESKEMGKRKDGKNLVNEWLDHKNNISSKVNYVHNLEGFENVTADETDYLLGLFEYSHMQYEFERVTSNSEPSITDMTKKAIQILSKNSKGYFLLVEGGRIDHGHHDGMAKRALEEVVSFDKAIKLALEMTNREDTLLLVTADHSHTMTISGYPLRGNNILGTYVSRDEKVEYTVLGYANGPGYNTSRTFKKNSTLGNDYKQPATFYLESETHGGEDVPVFAIGAVAHLFHGVHDQTYIPHAIGYAACIGPNKDYCKGAASISPIPSFLVPFVVLPHIF
ncbi:alkaline phosphatase-like isoform X3 [Limulus polyphemus]|uniref:alkaline phosphatase n=1 Tax=Limulus polyphemus TaxID=6850 RepID=A0ABM1TPI2_LIMPO|nr:alkaline phosphatase-like isoform X3 [Limulus polyphemus]